MTSLDAVLAYLSAGLSVMPLVEKKPALISWQRWQTGIPPKELVAAWFEEMQHPDLTLEARKHRRDGGEFNVAIVTGRVSGVFVVDVDSPEGLEEVERFGILHTLTVETSKAADGFARRHLYLEFPHDFIVGNTSPLRGCDVRGQGGYVAAPPSLHPSGARYGWQHAEGFDRARVLPAPGALLDLLRPRPRIENGAPTLDLATPTHDTPTPKLDGDAQGEADRWLAKALDRAAPGRRNETGFWLASQLRDARVPVDVAEAAMLEYARSVAQPADTEPYTEAEALRSLASAYGTPAREPARPVATTTDTGEGVEIQRFHRTDAGMSEWLAARLGDRVRFRHDRKTWLLWDGFRWKPDCDGALDRLLLDAVRDAQRAALDIADSDTRAKVGKWAISFENTSRRKAARETLQSLKPIATSGTEFDANPWLIGVSNGALDLRAGTFRAARPADFLTMSAGTPFDAGATCPRWMRFLDEVFAGDKALIAFIRRAVGYCLTGDVSEQVLFLLHGGGCNGKSVFLNVVASLLGDYAATTPFSTFELLRNPQGTNDVAALVNKRFVSARETQAARRLNEGRVKAVTGGDPITARLLYSEFFTYRPQFKVWLAVNHRPVIRDTSVGMWRRVRLVPFGVSFIGREDSRLETKLLGELPGILNWALAGCAAWQRDGLRAPGAVRSATDDYRAESDVLQQFLNDRAVVSPNARARASELFAVYRTWCDEQGERPWTGTLFGRALAERGFRKQHTRTGAVYVGIASKTTEL